MRMTPEAARGLFESARVTRLATVSRAGEPHLVPVTFALIEPAPAATMIVFAVDHKPKSSAALRRLDNIAGNSQVTFLVDHYSDDWDQLWWVRADAGATVIDGELRHRALAALRTKYVQYERLPPSGVVVGARVTKWTGWQFAAAGPATG